MTQKFRIGTVGYLNALPLTVALDRDRYDVVMDHPRGIAAALAAGEVDVALAPVAAVLSEPSLRIVPGWCVGADGPVTSVVIAAETPPEAWTEVLLDGTSRTSVTLARLLLTQGPLAARVRTDLKITDVPPGDAPKRLGGTVAGVVIGDPALALPKALVRVDLAEAWKAWTGRPFVFAVWAARADLPQEVRDELRAAGGAGVASIASRWAGAELDYLTHAIRYPLDDHALMGLRRYAALAHAAGLIGSGDVWFLEPAIRRHPRVDDVDRWLGEAAEGVLPDAARALALWRDAPLADLATAAHLRRRHAFDGAHATYLRASVGAARVEGATAVVVPPDVAVEDVAVAHDAGLDVVCDGVPAAASVPALAAAGLRAVTWTLTASEAPVAALAAARAADVYVDAALWLTEGVSDEALVARLIAARDAGVDGVTVHLPLPVGSMVEPGRPTPARWLRAIALARLVLPDTAHVSASPRTQGGEACQAALVGGADDLGVLAEGWSDGAAVHAFPVDVDLTERGIRLAGFEVARRDARFTVVGDALTRLKRVRPVESRARADG